MKVLNLKDYRKKSKLTQIDVAEAMNVTQAQYSRWENGVNFPDPAQILKLCELFSATPNELFGLDGSMSVYIDPLFQDE